MSARRLARAACALLSAAPIAAQEPARGSDRVDFIAAVGPDTVYVGEQATYSLTVRIPTAVRQRLRRNPEFVPPDPRAMLAYDLPLSREPATAEEVEVHVFRRALFALSAGRYQVPSARLTYSLPQSPSFFSREEERTLRSDGVSFVAVDPPERGRPAAWLGAVGRWRVSARLVASRPRVGDPFVLILRVEGEGNAILLPRPPLEIAWADVVASDERIVLDSTPTLLAGAKEFLWLVTPRERGMRQVPPVAYVFFDPADRRYVTARSAALGVSVGAGDRVVLPPRPAGRTVEAPLVLRPALVGAARLRLPASGWWIWIALLVPIPWCVVRLAPGRAGRTGASRAAPAFATGRGGFDAALRERTGIVSADVTMPGALARALRLEGVSAEAAAEAEALRDAFDAAAFAPRSGATDPARTGGEAPLAGGGSLSRRAAVLLARIAREARRRTALLVLVGGALASVVGCRANGAAGEEALVAFAEGRTAYAGSEFARAQEGFQRAARAAPRDPAVWANLGAAAWQARDTAVAVLGWQRALRLDPTDRELRSALARVRAPQSRGAARVWPVPPEPLAVVAALLWVAAWTLALARRDRGVPRAPSPLLLLPSLALTIGAAWLDGRLASRDLAVVSVAAPLLSMPALGAEPGPVPMVGEVVHVVEWRGVWVRLELSGARGGWYPAERTLPLARD